MRHGTRACCPVLSARPQVTAVLPLGPFNPPAKSTGLPSPLPEPRPRRGIRHLGGELAPRLNRQRLVAIESARMRFPAARSSPRAERGVGAGPMQARRAGSTAAPAEPAGRQ